MRMVRAIALVALLEAARHGAYRATFHGFRVESVRRKRLRDSTSSIEVRLDVTLAGAVVESCELEVDRMQAAFDEVEQRRTRPTDTETFLDDDGH
jgi:hypothetical protein